MTKLERVRAALGCLDVDRPPYGFWTHLPGIDLDPLRLAAETAAFAQRYDLDFVKSMPNGLYCVEDWGCICDYGDIERDRLCRTAFAHFEKYFLTARNGGGSAASEPHLEAYDRAAQAAVDYYGRKGR